MKLLARTLFVSSVALSTAFLGGVASADQATATGSCSGTGATAEAAPSQSHHGRLAREILAQLDLTPQQKASVESIARITKEQDHNMHVAGKKLAAAIADQLARGNIDANALAPEVNAFADAAQCHAPAMQAALDELHRVLDHDQRNKLVDLVEQHLSGAGNVLTSERWIGGFGERLGLNDQQKAEFQTVLRKYEPTIRQHREIFHKLLEAFRNDSFSAANAMPSYDPQQHARQMAQEMIDLAQSASRILTPQQRQVAARMLESRIQRRGEMAPAPSGQGKENVGSTQQRIIVGGFGYPGVGLGTFGYPGVYGGFGYPLASTWAWPGLSYGFSYPYGYGYTSGYSTAYGYPYWGGWSTFW